MQISADGIEIPVIASGRSLYCITLSLYRTVMTSRQALFVMLVRTDPSAHLTLSFPDTYLELINIFAFEQSTLLECNKETLRSSIGELSSDFNRRLISSVALPSV